MTCNQKKNQQMLRIWLCIAVGSQEDDGSVSSKHLIKIEIAGYKTGAPAISLFPAHRSAVCLKLSASLKWLASDSAEIAYIICQNQPFDHTAMLFPPAKPLERCADFRKSR